jgi:glutaminyl-tRNA synthetase
MLRFITACGCSSKTAKKGMRMSNQPPRPVAQVTNFIRNIIEEDRASGKHGGRVCTRFPPEPNGYLHVGHAKSICLNFGLAIQYSGQCNLRMDDTNPTKEDHEYVESIKHDVEWLGFSWGNHLYHASDYFDKLYEYAVLLIKKGKAYVCSQSPEEVRASRGTLTEGGKPSPDRDRPIEESLDLFERMRKGEFPDGKYTLRAKIDMNSGNINMRDPAMYRIRKFPHQMTGDKWCIYPMYDYAHCVSDAEEGITHSLCTLEFEDHRPLYDWYLEQIGHKYRPRQIEFARLNLNYTVTSKRKLKELVDLKLVEGWDDPRLPTIQGMRRRGYTPASLRLFCDRIGISKKDTVIDMSILEDCVREDLNHSAPRAMGVLDPIKVVINNYDSTKVEELKFPIHMQRPEMGERTIPFCNELYIERDDFMEEPPKDFFRLGPGREVRLRGAYILKCESYKKDPTGKVIELNCTVDHATLGKNPEGRKVKGIIHWVSARHAIKATVRIYDRLFSVPAPDSDPSGRDYKDLINPKSLEIRTNCFVEPSVASAKAEQAFQFERLGYFSIDKTSTPSQLVMNRTVTLRDSWGGAQSN